MDWGGNTNAAPRRLNLLSPAAAKAAACLSLLPPASGAVSTISERSLENDRLAQQAETLESEGNGRRPQNCTVAGWRQIRERG